MKFCDAIEIADGFAAHAWPTEIIVDRGMIDTPPDHVKIGRRGCINIDLRNGWAQYWRSADTPLGWKYRLVDSAYKAPAL